MKKRKKVFTFREYKAYLKKIKNKKRWATYIHNQNVYIWFSYSNDVLKIYQGTFFNEAAISISKGGALLQNRRLDLSKGGLALRTINEKEINLKYSFLGLKTNIKLNKREADTLLFEKRLELTGVKPVFHVNLAGEVSLVPPEKSIREE